LGTEVSGYRVGGAFSRLGIAALRGIEEFGAA
jgi:hypothetical protein